MKIRFDSIIWLLVTLFAAAPLMTGCVANPSYSQVSVRNRDIRMDLAFSDRDRDAIYNYYRRTLPPGLAKKQRLPPGLRKHLARHGELPPGLSSYRLPHDLDRRLVRLPNGYVRLIVGTDIVLLHERTHLILDVVQNIYP
jgi:diadenosine tetraphosphatase ApaH/serine/threonine PP2A family protein phosphatase